MVRIQPFPAKEQKGFCPMFCPSYAGKRGQAGYGKRWFETLKAAIAVIPNPLLDSEAIPKSVP
jgi:hypothetical protein